MNWVRFVARRYLKAKRNNRFLSLSTGLSMGGIGLGVAAIIVVLSVMNGFERQLREKLVTSDLHVLITAQRDFPGFDQGWVNREDVSTLPAIASMASSREVDLFTYVLGTEVVLRAGNKVSGVEVKGIEENKMERVRKSLTEEALPQMMVDREGANNSRYPGVFIGKELAYEMGLIPGDFITMISPSQMDGPFSNIPRIKRFIIQGIYHFGVPDQESHVVFTPIVNMESFLHKKGMISSVEISLKNSDDSAALVSTYRKDLSGLKIRDWNELNSSLFASMKLERLAMFLILLFTVIISSLNIVSTLTLLVQEKLKEISIFKTMGATPKNISGIFVWKGILIGGSGVLFGTLSALVICIVLKKFQFIALPDVYYDRTLPVTFDLAYFLGVPCISFAIVCIASYFPAKRAAALTPLEGLRGY
ncbi:MAG: ABC transporter permease [Bdellovibrionales bacterium]|nr:ABC transporter permease [Oligoflexia bacterium]